MNKTRILAALAAAVMPLVMQAEIKLFVVNDCGRNGAYEQKNMADLLGRMAEAEGPEAVLAVGDTHHYMGVQSVSDPLWMTNYELIYSHPELQVPWLPVLGNHEYRGNSQAVLDYSDVSRRWQMPARYYSQVFNDDKTGTSVRVVFLDTAPLIDKYRKESDTYPDVAKQDMDAQLQWLDSTLTAAKEQWVVVVGHHPVRAYTKKAESERTDLQKRLEPIFDRHRVHLSLGGHVHNFQHIRHNGRDYVVNGSASQTRKADSGPETQFAAGVVGFSTISATPDRLVLTMIDVNGKPLHTITVPKTK